MTVSKQLRLKSSVLENIFCYQEVAVEFTGGVSVFSGANGSGKSSLLEAVYFGLFSSSTKGITGRDMRQVLRNGTRKGTLEVSFTLGAAEYTVYLALKRDNKGDVSTDGPRCLLTCNGTVKATGVKQIAEQVEALLNMSGEDFAHCLYVRQGVVDQLIQATQQERQSIIDRLLRLTKVDEYKQRLDKESRRALRRRQDHLLGALEKDQKAHKELSSAELPAQLAQLEKELAQLEEQRKGLSSRHTQALEERRKLQDTKDRFGLTVQKMQELQEEYKQRKAQYDQSEQQLHKLKEELRKLQAEHKELEKQQRQLQHQEWWQALGISADTLLTDLVTKIEQDFKKVSKDLLEKDRVLTGVQGEIREKGNTLRRLEVEVKRKTEEAQRVNAALEQLVATLSRHLQKLDAGFDALETFDLNALIAKRRTLYEERRKQLEKLREEKVKLQEQHDALQEQIKKAESLIRAGKCPTCQQPVTAATSAVHLDPLRAQHADCAQNLKSISPKLHACEGKANEAEAEWSLAQGDVQSTYLSWKKSNDEHNKLGRELQEAHQLYAAETAALTALKLQEHSLAEARTRLRLRLEQVETDLKHLKEAHEIEEQLKHQAERVEQRSAQQATVTQLRDRHREELANLTHSFEELKSQLGELDMPQLDAAIQQWGQRLVELETKLKTMDDKRGALNRLHGELKGNYDRLEKLGLEIAQQQERLARLASLEQEVQKLGELYEQIRLNLRQQNLAALNGVFNEFFKLMDPSPAYDRIELNQDFDIDVVRTDEQRMSPSILSGGERALINLALRAAIHAVISEAGGVLLPLLFDEPTVFLDQNHVQQLERLFEALGPRAGQVIVVSHEASLVESADHEYRVSKDADNLGRVEKIR